MVLGGERCQSAENDESTLRSSRMAHGSTEKKLYKKPIISQTEILFQGPGLRVFFGEKHTFSFL